MKCEHTVEIDAPVATVYAVLADVARWPAFMSILEDVHVLGHENGAVLVEMREAAGQLRATPVYRVTFDGGRRMHAVQVRGALGNCEVCWRLYPSDGATSVKVLHRFSLGWPLVGCALDRFWIAPRIVHPVVERSLANFKTLVETGWSPKIVPA